MSRAREDRLEQLFDGAMSLPPEAQSTFLRRECGTDTDLHDTLELLLADAARAHDFGDRILGPAVTRLTEVLLGAGEGGGEGPADSLVGFEVAHFRILEWLGGGGMGRVYKALDLRLDRVVALKVLPPHLTADSDANRRFAHEARAASALEHPNICVVHETGQTETGQHFIAMAYCAGETLKQKIARGPFAIPVALDYVAQVADALQRAHDAGIEHRDVKPANVIVTEGGVVKLVDFGLAKMAGTAVTRDGRMCGTVAYMSPEQVRGDVVDARADLWSVGALLYEMLTARRPFGSEHDAALIYAIRHDTPKPIRELRPEIPAGLAHVVHRCLEKDPARRYQGAGELLADVRSVQRGAPTLRARASGRALRYGGVGAVLAALLLTVVWIRPTVEPGIHSLAVLPQAVGPNSVQAGLAEGMADMLVSHLSRLSALQRVVSRTAVAALERTGKTSQQIGRELGVDALVEMSVVKEGELIRIAVELVGVDAGRVLWRHAFERLEGDVLSLQREMAQAIATEIQVQLTPQERARLVETAPRLNPDAFALYLQSARMGDVTAKMRALEQAIGKDSTFALAHAKVAVPYIMLLRDKAKAERAIATALTLDPLLSDAYDALGLLRSWLDRDWPAAETAFRHAIELNPHNSLAHHELGMMLMRVARCDEAVVEAERAVLQSPGVPQFQSGIGEVYKYCRRYDDALREFRRNLDLVRDSAGMLYDIAEVYFHQGRYTEAFAMYQQTSRPIPAWAYAALGREREARAQIAIDKAEWARGGSSVVGWRLARSFVSLGDRSEALLWLERTYDSGSGIVVYLRVHPQFDVLRAEPRFQALLRKAHLAS